MRIHRIALAALIILAAAGTASAQNAGCKDTTALNNSTFVVNPTIISFTSPEHPLIASYTIGVVLDGVDPNAPGTTFLTQTILPPSALIANIAEADCYNAQVPLAVQATLMLLQRVRVAVKYVRADGAEGVWGGVSNPFVKAGTAGVVTGVRMRR